MRKILFLMLLCITTTFSNNELQKTSQLEMFLFKIGFESLLNDIKLIKEKSNVNSDDIESINKKLEYIIAEITKNSVNLEVNDKNSEIDKLRNVIVRLEDKIELLENSMLHLNISKSIPAEKPKEVEKITRSSDTVILNDKILDDIEKKYSSAFSIQIGLYEQQDSINYMLKKYAKKVTENQYTLFVKSCFTCKNKKLKKILIDGFSNRKEAEAYIASKSLKNVMIVSNQQYIK